MEQIKLDTKVGDARIKVTQKLNDTYEIEKVKHSEIIPGASIVSKITINKEELDIIIDAIKGV